MLPVMALQLEPASPVSAAAVGELMDPSRLAARAAEVAARQRSPETRRTYGAVYRMCPHSRAWRRRGRDGRRGSPCS